MGHAEHSLIVMRGFFIALAIAAFIFCAMLFQKNASQVMHWINGLGLIAPVIFLLLYCVATVAFLPTMVLTFAGGALFGPFFGTIFNLAGATIGASCAFMMSRYLFSDWFSEKKSHRFNHLIAGVERRGWQFVALLRIVPIIPFNLVNYALGLTQIKFSHYVLTTFVFLTPFEIISTYCGYAGMDLLIHPGQFYQGSGILLVLTLVFVLIFTQLYKPRKKRLKSSRGAEI